MAKSPELLTVLLERGANLNVTDSKGNTLMHTAESPELMAVLLSRNLDPNATNKVRPDHKFNKLGLSSWFVLLSTRSLRTF